MDLFDYVKSKKRLSRDDWAEITKINERHSNLKYDSFVTEPLARVSINEYISNTYPKLSEEFLAVTRQEADERKARKERKRHELTEQGIPFCSECMSTDNVCKCEYCSVSVCKQHNHCRWSCCCYSCYDSYFGDDD